MSAIEKQQNALHVPIVSGQKAGEGASDRMGVIDDEAIGFPTLTAPAEIFCPKSDEARVSLKIFAKFSLQQAVLRIASLYIRQFKLSINDGSHTHLSIATQMLE